LILRTRASLILLASLLLIATCAPAFGYTTTVTGTTSAVFGDTGTNITQRLTFNGTTFSGALNIPPGNLPLTLGNFQLGVCSGMICGNTYNTTMALSVGFTAPPGVGGSSSFNGLANGLVGRLFFIPGGSVTVDFDNTPQLVQYVTPGVGKGSFYLSVNDATVNIGNNNGLTGAITGATFTAVPEPSSFLLLGTLAGGLGLALRRKLKAKA
jgi:PEP-CTERM motif